MIERRSPASPTRVTPEQAELLRPRLAQFRLLLVAPVVGIAIFSGIVIAVNGVAQFTWPPSTLSLILLGLSVGIAIQAFILPRLMQRNAGNRLTGDTAGRISLLSGVWFSSSLVGAAMLESCAMINIVGYLMEHDLVHIGLAGLFTVLMSVHFPTMNRLLDWIDSNLSER